MDRNFLGRGVAFPVETDASGALAVAEGDDDIEQAIRVILGTARGERVMRPEFGCGIHDRVFESVDTTTRTLVESDVREALREWEPRITVLSVTARDGDPGELLVDVDYRVRSTNTERNLVYPFYLGGE
ncbi:MAG: GPW/gp25 family protein [Haloferacaceae archaeon]